MAKEEVEMGEITDITNEDILAAMDKVLADDELNLWTNLEHIAAFVKAFYWEYWKDLLGLGYVEREIAIMVTLRLEHDIIDVMKSDLLADIYEELARTLHVHGTFWNFITNGLGIAYDDATSIYSWIAGGWKNKVDARLTDLEAEDAPFNDETLAKLLYVADHYEEIKALVEDDITFIISEVMDQVTPMVTAQVTAQMASYISRLEVVEQIVASHEFFFFDWLMDVVAWLLTGMTIPIDDIEDALITVGEWFIDEIFKITDPLEARITALEEGTSGGIGLTEEEVRAIVNEMIADLEGIAGPQGPVGPPGPAGPIGPAGPPGDVEFEITDHLNDINTMLYGKLTQATGITTDRLTGVIDWILATYGERFAELSGQITPISEFLTDDMRTSLTGIVEAFGTPEALISFILDVEEGQEDAMLELMQILISMTFERGII